MILHKETFKKFGYWPKDIRKHSHKKIISKCPLCKKIWHRGYYSYTKSSKKLCIECARHKCVKLAHKAKMFYKKNKIIHHTNTVYNITPEMWTKLYFSGHFARRTKGQSVDNKLPQLQYWDSIIKKYILIKAYDTISLLSTLGNNKYHSSTSVFKNCLKNFLQKQSINFKFEVLNIIIKRYSSKTMHRYKNYDHKYKKMLITTLSGGAQKHGFIFDCAGFKYKTWGKRGTVIVTQGSFFIDGKWIHIGDEQLNIGAKL